MRTILSAKLIASVLYAVSSLSAQTQHNLLLIIPDDLGVDSVGCYGGPHPAPTPTLDALAQGGMRFSRMFANPSCTPSRAAFMTGRYAFRNGTTMALPPGAMGMTSGEVVLPLPLGAAGYSTAMIGKWHLGNRLGASTPNAAGWNHFEGVLDSGVGHPYQWTKITDGVAAPCSTYIMTDQVDSAITWIQYQTGPWVLALTPTLPHAPYHTPPAYLHSQNLTGLSPATTPRPFFEAMVQAMDHEIARLIASLPASVRANTNIVVIPDNGTDPAVAMAPIPPDHSKGSLYEFGSHVPLIVNGPAVATPGSVCNALVSGVDLFPTLLDLCGVAYPGVLAAYALPLDGVSFAPLLTNPNGIGRPFVYSEIDGTPLGQGYTVRTDTHRLVRYMRTKPQHQEMYDLTSDPLELGDLLPAPMPAASTAAFNDLMAKMETVRYDGWAELFGAGCPTANGELLPTTQTTPRIGTNFFLYANCPSPSATGMLGVLGFSNASAGGVVLPASLSNYGMPGCQIAVRPDFYIPFLPSGYSMPFSIPNISQLYRGEFYVQMIVSDPLANPTGLSWTKSLHCTIGM